VSTDNRRMTDRDGVEWMPTSEARRLIVELVGERDEARAERDALREKYMNALDDLDLDLARREG